MIHLGIELHNVQAILERQGSVTLSRVPEAVRQQLSDLGQAAALNTCGVELRFNLDGDEACVILERQAEAGSQKTQGILEVYHGDFAADYAQSPQIVGIQPTEIWIRQAPNLERLIELASRFSQRFDPRLVRVILPYDAPIHLLEIRGQVSPPRTEQSPFRQYLAYGSSITHGGTAVRPSESYAMRLANDLGADLTNLGFAGSAHLEPALAHHIAAQHWEIATLELGINVIGLWTPERFQQTVRDFLRVLVDQCPERPIFCTDLFLCERDLRSDEEIRMFRAIVKAEIERLAHSRLHYCSGLELLTSAQGLTTDLVHPSAVGMEEIARRWAALISPVIGTVKRRKPQTSTQETV